MPYTVRAAQNGEVTDDDYIEPDGVHGEAAVSATMCMHVQPSAVQLYLTSLHCMSHPLTQQPAQQQDAEYSIPQPRVKHAHMAHHSC